MAFAPDYATSGRFYVYLTAKRRGRDRRSASTALGGDPTSPTRQRALLLGDPARRRRQPQRRPAAVRAGRQLWLATGDGGGGNDQFGHCAGRRLAARQAAQARPRRRRDGRAARARACATRGGSRSTARRAELVIADVGQGAVEEINRRPRRPTTAGRASRARARTGADPRCDTGAAAPVVDEDPRPATASARSPAATSSATRACRRCSAATSTATSATPRCARSTSRTPATDAAVGLDGRRPVAPSARTPAAACSSCR